MDDLRHYLEQWKLETRAMRDSFRWHVEIDPERLEYIAHAVFTLDEHPSYEGEQRERSAPNEGREFNLVLVHALLHALEMDSPARAAFVDQLRSSWPIAAEAI